MEVMACPIEERSRPVRRPYGAELRRHLCRAAIPGL